MTHAAAASEPPATHRQPAPLSPRHYGVLTGTLVSMPAPGDLIVEFADPTGEVVRRTARRTIDLNPDAVGHPIVLMFVDGDLEQPIVIGRVDPGTLSPPKKTRTKTLVLDGRELVLEADATLTLRCGKSSLTLTREGRILLRGTNLVSHASGVNRIRGGTIKLN